MDKETALKLISKLNRPAVRDLLVIIATAGAFLIASAHFDVFGGFPISQIRQKEHLTINIVILFLSFSFLIFSWRRWRELTAEVRIRKMLEKELRQSNIIRITSYTTNESRPDAG